MSVTSFKEIHDGRDGESSVGRGGSVRRYTRVWRAITDSNYDDATVVESAAPGMGAMYPYDPAAYLQSRRAVNEPFSKRVWIVTGSYSTERELMENPLDDPVQYRWTTQHVSRVFDYDVNDQAILNSAGDPFDPPIEGDDAYYSVQVTRNVVAVPTWTLDYIHAVNSDSITIDGLAIDVGLAKISDFQLGEVQTRNDITYRVLSLRIDIRRDGWVRKIADMGMRQLVPEDPTLREDIWNHDGTKVSHPVLLDGAGLAQVDPQPSDAVFLEFTIYPSKAFASLPLW